ncbi:MAG: MBL fold metallo-hydrolase [Cyclobacteriaceae bacterium]
MNMHYRILLSFALMLAVAVPAFAQWDGDKIETDKGVLHIKPISHGTLAMQWQGKTIYVDPVGGGKAFKGLPNPDIILITHIHGDHMSKETLSEINTSKATLYTPQSVADSLRGMFSSNLMVMANGDKNEMGEITIHAVPMYNLPRDSQIGHPEGRGNGYVLEMGGKKIYISGDTEGTGHMRDLEAIDVAFVCMNLPYTMDIYEATSAVIEFKPAIVYPYHYRGKNGLSDVDAFKKMVESETEEVDVRLREWYPKE